MSYGVSWIRWRIGPSSAELMKWRARNAPSQKMLAVRVSALLLGIHYREAALSSLRAPFVLRGSAELDEGVKIVGSAGLGG